jgi:hypothetical protein
MLSFGKIVRWGVVSAAAFAVTAGFVADRGVRAAQAQSNVNDADYVGAWHLMFQGKSFATMTIERHGDQFTGSLTGVSIEMDDNGKLTNAAATNGPASTLKARLEDGAMHLSEKDGDDEVAWTMTLSSPTTAELRFAQGAPAQAQAIRLEKLWSEPPVQP